MERVSSQQQLLVQSNLAKIEKKIDFLQRNTFKLQFLTKSSDKRKGLDHEVSIAFCLPISLTTSLIVIWVHNGPKSFSTTNFSSWPRISDLIRDPSRAIIFLKVDFASGHLVF